MKIVEVSKVVATAAALHDAYQKTRFDFGGIFQDCISCRLAARDYEGIDIF